MPLMSKLVYSLHIELLPKGGFYINVPALPECRTTAKTFDSALNTPPTNPSPAPGTLTKLGRQVWP